VGAIAAYNTPSPMTRSLQSLLNIFDALASCSIPAPFDMNCRASWHRSDRVAHMRFDANQPTGNASTAVPMVGNQRFIYPSFGSYGLDSNRHFDQSNVSPTYGRKVEHTSTAFEPFQGADTLLVSNGSSLPEHIGIVSMCIAAFARFTSCPFRHVLMTGPSPFVNVQVTRVLVA
jgi:hypothetical protein